MEMDLENLVFDEVFGAMEETTIKAQQQINSTEADPGEVKYHAGDVTWILVSTALVFLMIPGVGYFYSGMAQSKNALSLIMLSIWSVAVVYVQWFSFGYSLTFSPSAHWFIGNFENAFLMGILDNPSVVSEKIPALLFCFYQATFAAITPALAIGSAAERGRFFPTLIFIFIWTTFVYDFVACWTWNPVGWSNQMGGLDFAGGSPVHICSGGAALAYALILGPRENSPKDGKPHNMSNVVLGTVLIWFGWFGFNGGSALASNTRAVLACINTNLAGSIGGITWVLIDYRHEKKISPLGFCAGVVAGMVTITPASGFVSAASSIAFGFIGAICCNLSMNLKHFFKYDDALDVTAVHGMGGLVGNILCGIFAQKDIALLDGQEIHGGGLDGHWMQVVHQTIDSAAAFGWSFIVTFIILFVMNKLPGLSLRADISVERMGMDRAELGLSCYEHVEVPQQKRKGSVFDAIFGGRRGSTFPNPQPMQMKSLLEE